MMPNAFEVARTDLFTDEKKLRALYPDQIVEKILRARAMHQWLVASPSASDSEFVREEMQRYGISRAVAYTDLALVKSLLPTLGRHSKEFARWRYNEMIMDTYRRAEKAGNLKMMEKCASSMARYNGLDEKDEMEIPVDEILVQPFTATDDPTVLGIKPIPNIREKIRNMVEELSRKSADVLDVSYEEADLEEDSLFAPMIPVNE